MSIENRLAAKKRAKQAQSKRKRRKFFKIAAICMIPVVICVIGWFIFLSVLEKKADNSSFLNANGTIKARTAGSYVELCDYKNISVKREDYLPTESELQAAIDDVLNSNVETVTASGTALEEDSKVNLTFKVKVDGKELTDLAYDDRTYTLGSNTMTEAFDKAVAKLKVGDDFSVSVNFPADYSNTELAAKSAVIEGKVVSVQVVPELTDSFVAEKLKEQMEGSEFPLTAEGFKNYCADNLYNSALEQYVTEYLKEKTNVKSYPYFYLKTQYYLTDKGYQNYVNYYNQALGSQVYASPVELLGLKSKSEYKKTLRSDAKDIVKDALVYQAIHEDAGLAEVNEEAVRAYISEHESSTYEELVEAYGYNYLAQRTLMHDTFEYVMSLVKADGDASKMWKADPATGADADSEQ